MAHLPEDNLPGEFDVIIDGTGAPECVRIRTLLYILACLAVPYVAIVCICMWSARLTSP